MHTLGPLLHADPIRTVIEISDSDSDISATASNWSVH